MIRLIVGLGNPGAEYEDTRHNAGFWWVDGAVRQLKGQWVHDPKYHGFVARVNRPEGPVWLQQPLTYMNLSGKAVSPLARFFKILPDEILVVHDELDIPPGDMKLKKGGGNGGHNGVKDIQAQLGTPDFWRLRLGIGHPGDRNEVANYVLRKPPAAERELIEKNVDDSLKALDLLLAGDMDKAMIKIHAKPPRPKPPRPPQLNPLLNAPDEQGTGGHAVAVPPCDPRRGESCGAGCGRHAGARRVTSDAPRPSALSPILFGLARAQPGRASRARARAAPARVASRVRSRCCAPAHLCDRSRARRAKPQASPKAASTPSTAQILAPSAATVPDALPTDKTIYRCGNTYSTHACADAKPLDVADARSDSQRRQAEDLDGRDKRLASWYEAGRRQRETVASAPARSRTATAPQCVSTSLMTCVPKKPRSRTVPTVLGAASAALAGKGK